MTILTIDDSATMRMLIKKTLLPDGYEILEAKNGAEGIETAKQTTIDLFYVDVNMPVMNGFDCVKGIKNIQKYSDTPIVFLTTVTDTEKRKMGQALGVNGWIQKPFTPDSLRKLTKTLLGIRM